AGAGPGGAGGRDGGRGRYLRPVPATPSTICRWASRNTNTRGSAPSTAEAICSALTMPTPLTTGPIPAGIVIMVWLVAARNGQRKLFQVQTKGKMETAAMAGRASGKAIRRYAVHQPAPSTSAACSSEIG